MPDEKLMEMRGEVTRGEGGSLDELMAQLATAKGQYRETNDARVRAEAANSYAAETVNIITQKIARLLPYDVVRMVEGMASAPRRKELYREVVEDEASAEAHVENEDFDS